MKDIVARILKEEAEASKMVQDAKEQAERIIIDARREKEDIISKIVLETNSFANAQKQETEKRFISEKDKILKETKEDTLSIREKKDKDIPDISRRVFSKIISIKD